MRARTRITIVLAVSLIVAGALALAVHGAAVRGAGYPSWSSYRDELLVEMNVSREGVTRALEEDPSLIFDAPEDDPSFGNNGVTIDQASDAVQRRALDRAADRSLRWAAGAFALVTIAAVVAAWTLAGRILRPLQLITARARAASGDDLSARVSLTGPDDEVKDLADTFDAMLDRIEETFDTQRRFSAQAAHELRTPLSVSRTEVEMLLDDLADVDMCRRLERVADATRRAERLVAQLHVLSRTDRGDLQREPFAFDELVGNVVGRAVESPGWRRVRAEIDLRPASAIGDRALVESLVRNLVDNAARHNRPNGSVDVSVRLSGDGGWAELEVTNTFPEGRVAPSPEVPGPANVGLTIVAAVLRAHDGTIEWFEGDATVTALVRLPAWSELTPLTGMVDNRGAAKDLGVGSSPATIGTG